MNEDNYAPDVQLQQQQQPQKSPTTAMISTIKNVPSIIQHVIVQPTSLNHAIKHLKSYDDGMKKNLKYLRPKN